MILQGGWARVPPPTAVGTTHNGLVRLDVRREGSSAARCTGGVQKQLLACWDSPSHTPHVRFSRMLDAAAVNAMQEAHQ